jgi:hypothetical protein
MRVTIVPDDQMVIIDGEALKIEGLKFPGNLHAVQWRGDHGEIEFKMDGDEKPLNQKITDFAPYQHVVDAWTKEKARREKQASPAS